MESAREKSSRTNALLGLELNFSLQPKFSTEVVMEIKRDLYLKNLISYMWDGQVKVLSMPDETAKIDYLKALILEVYLKDIVERKKTRREDVLSTALDLLCSSVGSLTNPNNIANSLNSRQKLAGAKTVAANTVKAYIGHLRKH